MTRVEVTVRVVMEESNGNRAVFERCLGDLPTGGGHWSGQSQFAEQTARGRIELAQMDVLAMVRSIYGNKQLDDPVTAKAVAREVLTRQDRHRA